MARTPIHTPGATAVGPYSHAIDDGRYVFCSGQTPIDPSTGKLREGGIGDQTRQCLENLLAVLGAAGLGEQDITKVNVFLTDMATFDEMNAVYASILQPPYPARTTIGVAALPLGAEVEIELIARRTPEQHSDRS